MQFMRQGSRKSASQGESMMAKPYRAYALMPIIILTIFAAGQAIADATPVRETTGVEISHVESLDLMPWAGTLKSGSSASGNSPSSRVAL
jgi:hypothetical protein